MLSDRRAIVLATLSGAVLPLAFAPFGVYPLAVLSLAALWFLWEGTEPRQAAALGFAWGGGSFLAGTYWLYISIHIFGKVPAPLAIFLMLALVGIMALYPALLGYLFARCRLHGSVRWLLVMPAAWVIVEWLRGWLFSGFPWLSLGYAFSDSWLAALAPLLGVHGVSLAACLLAGALVALVRGPGRLVGVGVVLAVVGGAAVSRTAQWAEPADRSLEVALIQGAVAQDRKWLPEQREPTKSLYLDLTRQNWDADLVLWPEAAIPAVMHQEYAYLERVRSEAMAHDSVVVLGMLEKDDATGNYYNAVLVLDEKSSVYRKRHLVPFGEYFPVPGFVRHWMRLMSLPYSDISAGAGDQTPLPVAGEYAAPSICYEDAFGAEQRQFLPTAGLLINVSNDAWFGDSIAPHQHLQIARMRALETGRYMLRATNTGISAVIDPDGRVVARSPQFQPDVLRATVIPQRGATPYVSIGNRWLAALAVLAVLAFAGVRRRNAS